MLFDEIGTSRLYEAESIREADRLFHKSCHCCTRRNRDVSCDKCSIAYVHELVVAAFEDMQKSKKGSVNNENSIH